MQGEERVDRELLDAAALAGQLIPDNSMFAFLASHRAEVFPDEDFADLFPSGRGRPSIPTTVMAAVVTLQTLHDFSDRETAEAGHALDRDEDRAGEHQREDGQEAGELTPVDDDAVVRELVGFLQV